MSVNIYDKVTGELIQIAGNGGGSIDDVNVSNKTTYSSEKIEEKIKTLKPTQDIEYEGIDVTCENTLEGKISDAVIKGKTYQNLFKRINSQTIQEQDNNYILTGVENTYSILSIYPAYKLQKNNKYTVFIDVKNINVTDGKTFRFECFNGSTWVSGRDITKTGLQKILLKTTQDITELRIQINKGPNCNITISKNIIILEGGFTNEELPASITGIESAGQKENKITILSHGKNLVNNNVHNWENGSIGGQDGSLTQAENRIRTKKYFRLPSNNDGYLSVKYYSDYKIAIRFYRKDKTIINGANTPLVAFLPEGTIAIPNDAYYYSLVCSKNQEGNISVDEIKNCKIQIEIGKTSTEYEPYKGDKKEILLPIEDGLKSLPNGVYDTIDQRADGVYLVQRVGKVVLNGSEDWTKSLWDMTNVFRFDFEIGLIAKLFDLNTTNQILCDTFKVVSRKSLDNAENKEFESICGANLNSRTLSINILKSKLNNTNTEDAFKQWLRDNPVTVCYELETPVETKLDINNLDLEVYKDTTYVTIDNAIQPTLSFKAQSNIVDVIKELNDKIEKNKNQYCYTHGYKFEVEKHFNIFNLNMLKQGNSFNSIYWPWIIRVDDKLDNPLGKYYLYYSTDHEYAAGGIGLAYSNNILDGFTDYGKIYQNENKETETPSVIYDYENKKFIIYFHGSGAYAGESQTSLRILSNDGINFDSSTLKKAFDLNHNELMGDLHNGYLHPFNIGDNYYAYSLMGGGDNCTSAFHISEDGGYTWKTDYKQMGAWGYNHKNDTLLNPFHGTVIQKYGIFWWVGLRSNFTSGSNPKTKSSIDIVPLNDFTHPAGKSSILISMDNEEYESNNIRQCTCFYDEGNIYILYQCGNIFNCAILK